MIKKLLLLFLLAPMCLAYNLNVDCLQKQIYIGDEVVCNIVLDKNVSDIFADQFFISAQGFMVKEGFIIGENGVDAYSNGLNRDTLLLESDYLTDTGQMAGIVASINLIANGSPGTYEVSLNNLFISNDSISDSVFISESKLEISDEQSLSGSISSSGSGGGGSGGSSSSSKNSKIINFNKVIDNNIFYDDILIFNLTLTNFSIKKENYSKENYIKKNIGNSSSLNNLKNELNYFSLFKKIQDKLYIFVNLIFSFFFN